MRQRSYGYHELLRLRFRNKCNHLEPAYVLQKLAKYLANRVGGGVSFTEVSRDQCAYKELWGWFRLNSRQGPTPEPE